MQNPNNLNAILWTIFSRIIEFKSSVWYHGEGFDMSITCQKGDICELIDHCGYGNCSNSQSSINCICPAGFLQGEGLKQCQTCETGFKQGIELGKCEDIDECENNNCGEGTCQNNIGSFSCICNEGFINSLNDQSAICGKYTLERLEKDIF